MKELDIKFYFGFEYYYAGEDKATNIEVSEELYERLHDIYIESGTVELISILEDMDPYAEEYEELEQLIEQQRDKMIENRELKGDNVDPETGEEFELSDIHIEMEIVVPEEWDE